MDGGTPITLAVFSAYLKCVSKAHLLITGQAAPSSYFVSNEAFITDGYRNSAVRHLQESLPGFEPIAFSDVTRDIGDHQTTSYVDCGTVTYSCLEARARRKLTTRDAASGHSYTPVLGGFKWSSQHGLCELIGGTGPEPRPVFSSPGSFAACC